jgi:hypothetical protein
MLRIYRRWRLKRSGALFRYYNGRRIVWGDVLYLYRRILHHDPDIVSLLPAVDEQKEPETSEFLKAIEEIFGLRRFDPETGSGLTESEIVVLFQRFLHHLEHLKKKVDHGFGPQPSTETGSGKSQAPL